MISRFAGIEAGGKSRKDERERKALKDRVKEWNVRGIERREGTGKIEKRIKDRGRGETN